MAVTQSGMLAVAPLTPLAKDCARSLGVDVEKEH